MLGEATSTWQTPRNVIQPESAVVSRNLWPNVGSGLPS